MKPWGYGPGSVVRGSPPDGANRLQPLARRASSPHHDGQAPGFPSTLGLLWTATASSGYSRRTSAASCGVDTIVGGVVRRAPRPDYGNHVLRRGCADLRSRCRRMPDSRMAERQGAARRVWPLAGGGVLLVRVVCLAYVAVTVVEPRTRG
jgi:hypothetical protein